MTPVRPTLASIDLAALLHNAAAVRRLLARGTLMCAAIKANAYGHGLIEVAHALEVWGVDMMAVALLEEGVALRQAGIATPILMIGGLFADSFDVVVQHRIVPVLSRPEQITALSRSVAGSSNAPSYPYHLEVDTGMTRLGFSATELEALLQAHTNAKNLKLAGIMTHLARADETNNASTWQQLRIFSHVCAKVRAAGHRPVVHAANSGGVTAFPTSDQGMVRPGLMLYGIDPMQDGANPDLRPVMTWRTRIVHLRDVPCDTPVGYGERWRARRPSRIATLPVGYGDGYPYNLGGRASVLVGGRRVPVVGAICMDLTMVDVTDVSHAELGDDVVLLGTQGAQTIKAEEVARWAHTISYEIVCGVGSRVPRRYSQ